VKDEDVAGVDRLPGYCDSRRAESRDEWRCLCADRAVDGDQQPDALILVCR